MTLLIKYFIGLDTIKATLYLVLLFHVVMSQDLPAEEYCMSEHFQPRCSKNEAILVRSAIYGRMRTGRCVTAEEVAAHRRNILGNDTQYFGCSADVLPILDRKCSGKNECDVRLPEIAAENIKPCFPGLTVSLEVSYECISILDDSRSCSTVLSSNPVHIIGSSSPPVSCGTNAQPWIIEAPVGQKISMSILDFTTAQPENGRQQGQASCHSRVVVVDKAAKRNTSICGSGGHRQELFLSYGNSIEIIVNWTQAKKTNNDSGRFILKLEAVGCSDLIPPNDAWLRRSDDTIVIGCYASRKSWHLECKRGHWMGVFGNCTQDSLDFESIVEASQTETRRWSDKQVVAMVAIGGFTFAVCLAILCIAVVCLRRLSTNKKQDYKTLNFTGSQPGNQIYREGIGGNIDAQLVPTYSVFVGDSDAHLANDQSGVRDTIPRAPL